MVNNISKLLLFFIPFSGALDTNTMMVLRRTIKVIQHLTTSDQEVGLLLVPYYRQLLAPMVKHKDRNSK